MKWKSFFSLWTLIPSLPNPLSLEDGYGKKLKQKPHISVNWEHTIERKRRGKKEKTMRGKRGDRRVQIFSSLGCRETVLNDGTETTTAATTQIPNRKTTARRPNTKTRQQTQTLTQNMAKIGERICAQMIISLCKRLKDWQQNCRKKTGWSTANKLSKSQQVSQPIDKYYYQMVTVISTKNAQQLRQSRLQRQIKQTGNSFVPHEQYRRNIDTLCSATVLNGKFKRVQMTTLHSSQSLSHSITKKGPSSQR